MAEDLRKWEKVNQDNTEVGKRARNEILLYKFIFFLSIFTFVSIAKINAQTQFIISQESIYDQNIFRNYLAVPDWVHHSFASLSQGFDIRQTHFNLQYNGDLFLFQDFNERDFHAHRFTLESFHDISQSLAMNVGATYVMRKNKPDFEIYDHSNLLFYSQFRFDKWQKYPIQFGYSYRDKSYQNLVEFNYREQFSFFSIKHFFETRTTLIGEINWASKKFTEEYSVEELLISVRDTTIYMGGGKGRGRGNSPVGQDSIYQTIQDTAVVAYNLSIPQTNQVILRLKLAQSIFSMTGLSFEFVKRFDPTKNIRYLGGQDYGYLRDDELYDDPYTYGSDEYILTLTQMLPWATQLKLYADFLDKAYVYQLESVQSEESVDTPFRKDKQYVYGTDIKKTFAINRFLKSVNLYISYFYLKNESNNYFFVYDNNSVNFGLDLKF